MPDELEGKKVEQAPYIPLERVQFKKKETASPKIPTASMPDIVFMLLLFFMVTTVFKEYTGLNVFLPSAKRIEKLPSKRYVTYLWLDKDGRISIDDQLVEMKQVGMLMYKKRVENPRVLVSMKIDAQANMGWVSDVHQQLREADALRINYSAKFGE